MELITNKQINIAGKLFCWRCFFRHLNYSKYLCILALFFVLSFFLDRLNSHFNCFYFKKWKQLYLLYILRFDFIFEALKFQVMWEAFLRWSIFLEGLFLDFEWWFCVMFSLLLWVLFHLSKKLLLKDSNEICSFFCFRRWFIYCAWFVFEFMLEDVIHELKHFIGRLNSILKEAVFE